MKKKTISAILIFSIGISLLAVACNGTDEGEITREETQKESIQHQEQKLEIETQEKEVKNLNVEEKMPKYIFLFIGDGMGYPQVQLTNDYLNVMDGNVRPVTVEGEEREVLEKENLLNMLQFPVTGTAQTYDSSSYITDSASAATAISTGHKTWSGTINMSEDFSEKYMSIAELLKQQKNYKVGIISSVNINHATPAAFYAHQESRKNYYEIGLEMMESDFDYFAGGDFRQPDGKDSNQTSLYTLAEEAGYQIIRTQEEATSLKAGDGKTIVITEKLADSNCLSYEIDREDTEWALSDYVEKGIEMLSNDTGFFMMVEGGKIDWACHSNDAAATIYDVIALDEAIGEAVEFYEEHPDETLILVTGDHETGGLSIGAAETNYATYLNNFSNQKISFVEFNSKYVENYKKNQTDFFIVMNDITELFGLLPPSAGNADGVVEKDDTDAHPYPAKESDLILTDYEYSLLKEAYEETLKTTGNEEVYSQEEYILYGGREPLTITINHILNKKSGIDYSSYAHTGVSVPVFALGNGAESFGGYYDNTDIFKKIVELVNFES